MREVQILRIKKGASARAGLLRYAERQRYNLDYGWVVFRDCWDIFTLGRLKYILTGALVGTPFLLKVINILAAQASSVRYNEYLRFRQYLLPLIGGRLRWEIIAGWHTLVGEAPKAVTLHLILNPLVASEMFRNVNIAVAVFLSIILVGAQLRGGE